MIHDEILAALKTEYPPAESSWQELEQMASSAPDAAIDLLVELARSPLEPIDRGWLAAGPLRTALASANEAEEKELESRAANEQTFAAMLDALVRYEQKQQTVIDLLERKQPSATSSKSTEQQIVIPNVHDGSAERSMGEDVWGKIVRAVDQAPENALLMLASTVLETLLLRNESKFRSQLLEAVVTDDKFRKALALCDLSFSESFLDELTEVLTGAGA